MLTCEEVRSLLPTQDVGDTVDVEKHIAACAACREERQRLAVEIENLRTDLTLLAPSPFLEEAVVEAARGARAGRPRARWPVVALAGAAAILLLLFALPRDGRDSASDTQAGNEDAAAAGIVVPPSAATVHEARGLNHNLTMGATLPPLGWNEGRPGLKLSRTVLPEGVVDSSVRSETFLPPPPRALHRFVYGDPGASPVDVAFRATTAPRKGVMLLGSGLLERIGGRVLASAGVDIQKDGTWWRSTPGSPEGEIRIASPETGGAQARIRVLVSTGYDGTLLLDEPLARALGLYAFEIPGRMQVEGAMTFTGQRARARVRLPELDFDEVIEVQVRPPDLGRPHDLREPHGIRIGAPRGRQVLPTEVLVGRRMTWTAPGTIEMAGDTQLQRNPDGVDWIALKGKGMWHVLLRFAAWLPDETRLVPGAIDVGAPTFLDEAELRLGLLEVSTPLAPGTPLTLARVWRGHTAIPSATAVVETRVQEGGRVIAPAIWGEQGATIRGLARGAHGKATFVDLVVDHAALATPWLWFNVTPNGRVHLKAGEYATWDEGALRGDALAALRADLGTLLDQPGWRDEEGAPRAAAVLHVAEGAPWRVVQALMQVGALAGVRDYRFQRADAAWQPQGGIIAYELPGDSDLHAPPQPPTRTLEVVLTQRPERGVTVRIQIRKEDGSVHDPTGGGRRWTVEQAAGLLQAQAESTDRVVIKVPPPWGRRVDAHSVIRLIDTLKGAGTETIELEGAALPLPR